MITLITVMCLDYLTGVIKAICEKKLSSSVGFKGILKKVLILLIVGLTVSLERIMPAALPLRDMTVFFFVANEGFSILENTARFIPLPEKLKAVLAQLQDKSASNPKGEDKPKEEKDYKTEQSDPQNPNL